MLKLNENYSDYVDKSDSNYPEGKAINASTSESYDGTPLLAEFMNDINAAHIAMYEKAYGNRTGISGNPDTQKSSQFANAVAKYTDDKVADHVNKRGLADGVHGATSSATAGQIACRDANGNIAVADAIDDGDAVNLKKLNSAIKGVTDGLGTAAGKTAGSAAGNVPLVGTALGTTNNNIVVTDTAGKLKPSGTALGSAAGKTAGSAVGNVPLVGTALGTTNDNILVTDTAGKLKPSGTTLGSAAGKTAGSAAGNVPLVGTALGTTDKNIVVTDTAGKLKPSGTTLGSAAGKTAGSAAGNVPLVGTALGTTDKNIVVTDTNGALKPSGTTVGSAASKTAGSAAGNVPTVGTALGTTDNNIVTTNTSGGLKPAGITPTQVAYWGNGGGVCSTAAGTQAKTVAISGFALYTGVTVKLLFTYGNSAANPTLNVNNTGAKSIKAVKGGSKIAPPTHSGLWRGAATKTTEAWQPLTTLELLYDGTDWVIMGNPEVENWSNANVGYSIKANGLIEQYGFAPKGSNLSSGSTWTLTLNFPIAFSDVNYKMITLTKTPVTGAEMCYSVISSQSAKVYTYNRNGGTTITDVVVSWYAIGD